jgi:polysaccharide chain length determinant protein (PEP-CTERM system associated)
MEASTEQIKNLLIKETFQARRVVVGAFCAILIVFLGMALAWPKGYTAFTTILVEEKNIIQPLMQGAAVATDSADRARMAREVIFGRKLLMQVLADTGRLKGNLSPVDQERLMKKLIRHTTLSNVGRNVLKIEYSDDNPQLAYQTTTRFAQLFIDQALSAKAAESKSAFEFIDQQVQQYHEKLQHSEDQLRDFRIANLDAQPGSDADVSSRLSALQARIDQATQDLKEAEIKKHSLQKQLSGETETLSVMTREGQYQARLADLQSQLDTLKLSYTDSYPDIVRLRHQIADLQDAIAAEKKRRENAKAAGNTTLDQSMVNNPMYQQLRRELSDTQVNMDMLSARIAEAKQQLQQELSRGKRVQGGEATLAEITRDYQVNRDIYQDLLKRRENARVSMNLDKDNEGLTFKIQEPATVPLQPSGLRFWHYIVIGLMLGVLAPLGLLYARTRLDGRIRMPAMLAARHKVPVLTTVPHFWEPAEVASARRELGWLASAIGGTLVIVALVSVTHVVIAVLS